MNITALFHKHSPFQSIQMPRRGCPRLREHVEHTRMQGTQLLWYPRSNHTWRLHNSGFGCHPEPLIWDSRSFLTGIGQGDATSSSVLSGNQSWFGQFGAMSITEAPLLFFLYIYTAWLLVASPNHPNRLRVQHPLSLRNPLPRKHVRPVIQKTGDVRCSDWEKVTVRT